MPKALASDLLERLGASAGTFALLGAIENDTAFAPVFQTPAATVEPEALPGSLRVDIALVRPHPGDRLSDITAILARLRDVHAGRVVICPDQMAKPDSADFIALGFEPRKSPSGDGLMYIWDPALADQPREWNDSRNWANPENFSKYRW